MHTMLHILYEYMYPTLSQEKLVLLELKQENKGLRGEIRKISELTNISNRTERNFDTPPFSLSASEIKLHGEHNTLCSSEICLQ